MLQKISDFPPACNFCHLVTQLCSDEQKVKPVVMCFIPFLSLAFFICSRRGWLVGVRNVEEDNLFYQINLYVVFTVCHRPLLRKVFSSLPEQDTIIFVCVCINTSNEQVEFATKKILFILVSKKKKYLNINLTKCVQRLYEGKYKTLMNEIKKN